MSTRNVCSKESTSSLLAQLDESHKADDSSSTLYVEWSNKDDATSPKQEQAPRRKCVNRKSSMDTTLSEISALSLGSAKGGDAMKATSKKKPALSPGTPSLMSLAALGLQQEKEHTEQQSTSSNSSLGSLGFLRRNASTGEMSAASSANTSRRGSITSRRGKRMSELTNNSNWDDDDDKSIDLEDVTNPSAGASGSSRSLFSVGGNASGGSSRSVFSNNLVDRVKHASSSNLSAFSDGLAEEAGLKKHRSACFKERVSVRVRRASDFLFSSHHKPTIDDVSEDGRLDDVSEEGSHDDVLDGL